MLVVVCSCLLFLSIVLFGCGFCVCLFFASLSFLALKHCHFVSVDIVVDVVAVVVPGGGGGGDDFSDEVVIDVVVMERLSLLCEISQGCYSTSVSVLPINSYLEIPTQHRKLHHLLLT